jgi:hypothetical protein
VPAFLFLQHAENHASKSVKRKQLYGGLKKLLAVLTNATGETSGVSV